MYPKHGFQGTRAGERIVADQHRSTLAEVDMAPSGALPEEGSVLGHARRRLTSFAAPPMAQQAQSPALIAVPERRFIRTLRIALITALVALLVVVSAAAVVALRRQDVYPGVRAGEADLGG